MKNVLILITAFIIGGCSTVAGVGKDVTDAAEWSKDTISKTQQKIFNLSKPNKSRIKT